MTRAAIAFVDALRQAADAASMAEDRYRREVANRIRQFEQARAFAFRRFNLVRELIEGMADAESPEIAVANGQAVLRNKLGWQSDSEPRVAVLNRFAAVAAAIHAEVAADRAGYEGPPAPDALADFEVWYEASHGTPFWVLFEHYMPETPLVDF